MVSTTNESEALVLQGFTVLQVKGSERSHASHYLFLRPHSSPFSCAEWPEGKTLVVYSVPPYCREENLMLLFKGCGEIVQVYLQPKPSGMPSKKSFFSTEESIKSVQVAYVVFKKPNGVKNACSMTYSQVRYLSDKTVPLVSGLRAYCEEYKQLPDVAAIEKEAEAYMAVYYKKKEEEEKKDKQLEGVPDEEGFIKVTRHGKNKGGRRTEETERKGHEHIRSRRKKNELKDFYTFQFRETKKTHIAELQAKFEEDKKRVKEMRMARKFKPF
ncbi:unnamed protein product [Candidula unifasciata]|uniref:Ribosomal RNA-processing protein 7 C-terminal domain-containing protein n=1 Tax=Candidula unifasciata TaxID=100452 RepID=A0A8S3Z2S2_9EUPU|nr:unnamed protein product [Candidula unifasciata]